MNLSAIGYSSLKSSKTLDGLIERVNSYSGNGPLPDIVIDTPLKIKNLKGLSEKIMEQHYVKFDSLYKNPEHKRYLKLDMQINDIRNKYKDFVNIEIPGRYSDLKSIPQPDDFFGTDKEWNDYKSYYEKLNNEYEALSSEWSSTINELYSKQQNLDKQTE